MKEFSYQRNDMSGVQSTVLFHQIRLYSKSVNALKIMSEGLSEAIKRLQHANNLSPSVAITSGLGSNCMPTHF
jgi:hypothetical protein